MEYNYRIGIALMVINVATLIICSIGAYLRFNASIKAETKREADQHFILLMVFLAFLSGNLFAFYTGYKAYVLDTSIIRSDIILQRLIDRSCMLSVSILLTWGGRLIPELKK